MLRIALWQINTGVGDIDATFGRVLDALDEAETAHADLAIFPELTLTGYPPEDLLLAQGFIDANERALERVAVASRQCAAVIGFVESDRDLFNAAAVVANGSV